MYFLDYINIFYFLLSLFIGFFFVYILSPTPNIIYKYPTPENCQKNIYKDLTNNCYKYNSEEIPCPTDKKLINNIPIQN